jgi:DNA-3-methyladenine glycosylase
VPPLSRDFYDRPTLDVARELLGKVLVHQIGRFVTAGRIVEVEAYIGESDPACHAAVGLTRRNEPLYGHPGFAYVYLNYGLHTLMNVVTEPQGAPAAVLIRALEPVEGIEIMRRRRSRTNKGTVAVRSIPDEGLCRGPGNLTRAMSITLRDNRRNLCGDRLYVEDRGGAEPEIVWTPRIGIRVGTEHQWRAHVVGSASVSGRPPTLQVLEETNQ